MTDHSGKQVSYSRKLAKEDGVLNWNKPAQELEREIRAFIEWPKSRTVLAGKDVVITSADIADISGPAGGVQVDGKNLYMYCGSKSLKINTLKPAGKKEMTAEAFLAGHRRLLETI
jgi:methionyl-tRNA formyltransferase